MTGFLRVVLLASGLSLLAFSAVAVAYETPAGGKWKIQNLFEQTDGGTMRVSKAGDRLKRLVLKPGSRVVDECGTRKVKLVAPLRIKEFKKVRGRPAIARLKSGLFKPIKAKFRFRGKVVRAKFEMLWDDLHPDLADSATFEYGDCRIQFFARK